MTKKQTEILQFLGKYKSCTEEQLLFFFRLHNAGYKLFNFIKFYCKR